MRSLMASLLKLFAGRAPLPNIEQFLNARNALLWLSDTNSQSFNGQALRSETDINTFGLVLHLSLKRIGPKLGIVLTERETGERVIDFQVSITTAAEKIRFNIDNLELNIELDAAPSERVRLTSLSTA